MTIRHRAELLPPVACQSESMGIAIEKVGERFVGAPRMDFAETLYCGRAAYIYTA